MLMAERSEAATGRELADITVCMVELLDRNIAYTEKEKGTLERQLQLLSERSREAKCCDLAGLSYAMELTAKRLLQHNDIITSAFEGGENHGERTDHHTDSGRAEEAAGDGGRAARPEPERADP